MSIILDIVLAVVLLCFISSGVNKGGARSVLELLSFVVTIIAVLLFKNAVTAFLMGLEPVQNWVSGLEQMIAEKSSLLGTLPKWFFSDVADVPEMAREIASFVLCVVGFVATYFVVRIVFRVFMNVTDKILSLPLLNVTNKLIGGVIGGVKGCLFIWVLMSLLFLFAATDFFGEIQSAIADSMLAKFLYNNNWLATLFK